MRTCLRYCYSSIKMELGMNFTLECEQECEQEIDGHWIAEVPQLPGVLAYGSSSADAMTKAEVLALRVIADRLENGESEPVSIRFSLSLPASVIGRQPKPKIFYQSCIQSDGELSNSQDLTRPLNMQTIRTIYLHSMLARRLAQGCWLESPSTPALNQVICDKGGESSNSAIHLSRPLMFVVQLSSSRRPCHVRRYAPERHTHLKNQR
jgi:predicted RNase H-like HicB family nuclease